MLFAALFMAVAARSQHTFKATVKDAVTKSPFQGVQVKILNKNLVSITPADGSVIFPNLSEGEFIIQYSHLGFSTRTDTVSLPFQGSDPLVIWLDPAAEEELDEVVISATRGRRTIDNIPTRVEVITGEEMDEKSNMKPGDIRMMLAETTGIQTQQTSATSANSSIRIQGLDGKYTQIIRDGFPLYSGFSGGLGLLQIAPLDLQQVEVVKGSASTLYGGGAIAGLVNLVSKKPSEERELSFLVNGTSARGLDVSTFYGEKFAKTGVTVYAAYNKGSAYDPASIGLTAIPKFDRLTLNPRLFFYVSERTILTVGLQGTIENRIGGDIEYIAGNGGPQHSYFERNKTNRYSTQMDFVHRLTANQKLNVRTAYSYFKRSIRLPNYLFSGIQRSTFSEASYSIDGEKADFIAGINVLTENFREDPNGLIASRSYRYSTTGGFLQHTWNVDESFIVESGIRGDFHNTYGFFLLPRLSALWKINTQLSTRLGGGLGYKAPSVFTEEAERIQFKNVLPVDHVSTKAERSYGANYDLNYRTGLFNYRVGLSVNQLFFYTRISNPIMLAPASGGNIQYSQPEMHLDTRGMETNVKLTFDAFKLFVGYTLADVNQHTKAGNIVYPLVSKHRLNHVLMYELEDQWKIGAEAYYHSSQLLSDGSKGRSYWTTGFLAEKIWKGISLFINFENFTDTRQTKFGPIYTGSITDPIFKDIYAPVDGFVMNGGIKVRL